MMLCRGLVVLCRGYDGIRRSSAALELGWGIEGMMLCGYRIRLE